MRLDWEWDLKASKGSDAARLLRMESIHADQFCGSLGRLLKSGIVSSVIRSATHLSCSILAVLRGLVLVLRILTHGCVSSLSALEKMSLKTFAALTAPVCRFSTNGYSKSKFRVPWTRIAAVIFLFCLVGQA